MRSRLRAWFAAHGGRLGLIVLLALATPIGTALQSAVGANVFSTRSLAASWPYLALAVAALITVGRPVLRITAAGLAVTAFALGAAQMTGDASNGPPTAPWPSSPTSTPGPSSSTSRLHPRPPHQLRHRRRQGVLSSASTSRAEDEALRGRAAADPAAVAERAIAAADGGPITVIAFSRPAIEQFVDLLPHGYVLTDTKVTMACSTSRPSSTNEPRRVGLSSESAAPR